MNKDTVPRKSQHNALSSLLAFFSAIPFLFVIAAYTTSTTRTSVIEPTAIDRMPPELSTDNIAIDPPDPALEPPADLVEQPLHGVDPNAPEVWLVPSLQSKQELATHIGVELTQLNWVNPGLPEPVTPGTLIVVPSGYLAQDISLMPIGNRLAVMPNTTVSPVGGGK